MHIITIHLLTYIIVKIKSPFHFTGMVIHNNQTKYKTRTTTFLPHKNLENLRKQRFYYKKKIPQQIYQNFRVNIL